MILGRESAVSGNKQPQQSCEPRQSPRKTRGSQAEWQGDPPPPRRSSRVQLIAAASRPKGKESHLLWRSPSVLHRSRCESRANETQRRSNRRSPVCPFGSGRRLINKTCCRVHRRVRTQRRSSRNPDGLYLMRRDDELHRPCLRVDVQISRKFTL